MAAMRRILDRSIMHKNITIRRGIMFGVSAGAGAAITLGLTYAFTEWAGWWYMASVVVASAIALAIKFFINAMWVFK